MGVKSCHFLPFSLFFCLVTYRLPYLLTYGAESFTKKQTTLARNNELTHAHHFEQNGSKILQLYVRLIIQKEGAFDSKVNFLLTL